MPSREHLRRFQFIREIASGGFGSVFLTKVMHADGFSRLVAVKLLKAQWSDSDEVARRMRDEARLLGLLRHRHIVDVIDLTAIDGRAAVIMEYLEAVDLRTVVQSLAVNGHRLPARAALEMAAAVASALDAAYNRPPIPGDKPLRVIHRDIKPSNIMVDENGMLKVLDFGVARSEIDNRESHTQELQFGSVDYMAPERLFFEPETPASDVYSLAATLFEILALEKFGKARGRPARHSAYVVDRLSFLRAGLGISGTAATELETLIGEGLAFNHEDRPTAAEFYQRARSLARQVESDDLGGWSERVIPSLVRALQEDAPTGNPLSGKTLTEDPRAFGTPTAQPASQSAGAADILRQGALAEMEDTGAFVPSPQTGAPAQLHGRVPVEPDPEDAWDDGPTAVGGLKGPVRVPRPDNPEEARQMQAGGGRRPAPVLPDPSDPFAQLVRSPLSPPKTPKPRAKASPEPADEGDTQVADALAPPVVPARVPSPGHYDPQAPESSGPVPPLPAPPGVEARPLAPELPAPVVPTPAVAAQSAASPASSQDATQAAGVAGPPPVVPDVASVASDSSPARGATAPASANAASQSPASSSPARSAAEAPPTVPGPPAVAESSTSPTAHIPVVPPPSAVFDENEATEVVVEPAAPPVALASPSAEPASAPDASEGPTPEAAPEPPSLDDVVPASPESRYGPELERLRVEEEASAPSPPVPVIPTVEPTHDDVSAPPSIPEAGPAASHEADSAPVLAVRPDADPLDSADTSAPPAKSRAPLFAAAGCFVFLLLGGAGIGGAFSMGLLDGVVGTGSDAVAEEGTTQATTTAPAAAEDTGQAAPEEAEPAPDGQLRVRSGADDTKKVSVTCGGGVKEEGEAYVDIPGDAEGPCRVKVILHSRKRLNAQIDVPAAGGVVCFAGGSDACVEE